MPKLSLDQIGRSPVRFPSGAPIPSMTDASTDPYARTRVPKEIQVEGMQFWPQQKTTYPGLVLLHEYWGLNAQIQNFAIRLATEGYVVLVPNLYIRQGGMVTANAEVAEALMSRVQTKDMLQDIHSCCEFLNTRDHVARNLHGVIGLGMGGNLAIQFACQRKRLRAAVSFYGKLGAPETLKDLNCPLLYHHPEANSTVGTADLQQLSQAASQYNKRLILQTYKGAAPSFMDETRKDVYHPEAAREAWDGTINFFNDCFKSSA
jgi:carboxymethylenebutenolidase